MDKNIDASQEAGKTFYHGQRKFSDVAKSAYTNFYAGDINLHLIR